MSIVLADWRIETTAPRTATVLPDGCRDVIVSIARNRVTTAIVTSVDAQTRREVLPANVEVTGIRLKPGATIKAERLYDLTAEWGISKKLVDLENHSLLVQSLKELVEQHGSSNDELIAAVAASNSVIEVSRQLGVTCRTLHRHVAARTGRTTSFWLQLSRARRVLGYLGTEVPLVEIAHIAGFSDQAHMTRAFHLTFGLAPAQFQVNSHFMRLAGHPGFSGNIA